LSDEGAWFATAPAGAPVVLKWFWDETAAERYAVRLPALGSLECQQPCQVRTTRLLTGSDRCGPYFVVAITPLTRDLVKIDGAGLIAKERISRSIRTGTITEVDAKA
jgi:hypothetical protein